MIDAVNKRYLKYHLFRYRGGKYIRVYISLVQFSWMAVEVWIIIVIVLEINDNVQFISDICSN